MADQSQTLVSSELPDGADHAPVTVIEPDRRWSLARLKELWFYRELFLVLALRDIKARYKQTVLGAAWAVLRPVLTTAVFTVIFGRLGQMPSEGYPYAIYVFSGLLPWTFFATALTTASASLVGSSNLVSKVYFPRLIVPIASVGVSLVDLLVAMGVMLLLMAYYGVGWTLQLALVPVMLVAVVFVALGVGILLAALSVAYRDFIQLVPFLVQTWLYLTPVIYPTTLVPEQWRWLLYLNPMTGLVEGFRAAFLGAALNVTALSVSFLTAALFMCLGIGYFSRVERRFADII